MSSSMNETNILLSELVTAKPYGGEKFYITDNGVVFDSISTLGVMLKKHESEKSKAKCRLDITSPNSKVTMSASIWDDELMDYVNTIANTDLVHIHGTFKILPGKEYEDKKTGKKEMSDPKPVINVSWIESIPMKDILKYKAYKEDFYLETLQQRIGMDIDKGWDIFGTIKKYKIPYNEGENGKITIDAPSHDEGGVEKIEPKTKTQKTPEEKTEKPKETKRATKSEVPPAKKSKPKTPTDPENALETIFEILKKKKKIALDDLSNSLNMNKTDVSGLIIKHKQKQKKDGKKDPLEIGAKDGKTIVMWNE